MIPRTLIGKPTDTYELFTEARWAYDRYLKENPGEINDAWIACFEVIRPYFAPVRSEISLLNETELLRSIQSIVYGGIVKDAGSDATAIGIINAIRPYLKQDPKELSEQEMVAVKAYKAFCHLRTSLGQEGNHMSPLCRKAYDELKDLKNPPKRESVLAELVEMNFEPDKPELTFAVPKDTRWTGGQYAITKIEDEGSK